MEKLKRVLKIILGIIFLIIGVIGCFLPILQGWAFIFAGIVMIWPEKGKRLVNWLKAKINYYRSNRAKTKAAAKHQSEGASAGKNELSK